ncbi:hypothetical protein EIQ30_16200 [Xanthomonas campestris]|nr:TIGR04141 family sporadically distributed protein [Xanthomonas campestris pv. armoraciae]
MAHSAQLTRRSLGIQSPWRHPGGTTLATFTIYLLRDSVKTAQDAIIGGAEEHTIEDGLSKYGQLFVKETKPKPPKWADLFENYIDKGLLGTVQSSSAAFIISVDKRFFALTFGQGRFLLRPDAYEERFGLIVTLNSINSDALRSIDKKAFVEDQNSRVQTAQAASALSFGVDIERDLVRGIVGRPIDIRLGRRLAGADALTVTSDVSVPGLKNLLRRYLKKFESKGYQASFPWIDQVRQLNSKGKIATKLDAMLVDKVKEAWHRNGVVDGCWLSVPDIVDWEKVDGFKFTSSKGEGVSIDLRFRALIAAYPSEEPSLSFLRKHYAMSVDEDEKTVDRWALYRCIHCEIDDEGKSYILSAGRWFEVDKEFVSAIERAFKDIDKYPQALPLYNHRDEGDYNESVADESAGRWCLMDKKMLRVGGIHDKVEFCDLYGGGEIIHVKHYGSSAVLAHLFNQGLVSGELLRSHEPYVSLANEELLKTHQLPLDPVGEKFSVRDVAKYTIIFAIISQSNKPDLHLPFFAKVILKSVHARLVELGYANVMLAKVDCSTDVSVAKVKPTPIRKRRARHSGLRRAG